MKHMKQYTGCVFVFFLIIIILVIKIDINRFNEKNALSYYLYLKCSQIALF